MLVLVVVSAHVVLVLVQVLSLPLSLLVSAVVVLPVSE